jgi:hypothetical protein
VTQMNDNQALTTAPSGPDVSRVDEQPEVADGAATASARAATLDGVIRRSGWTAGRIAALAIGALQILVALGLLGGGGTAFWYDRHQRDSGYVTTSAHKFSTSGSALVTERTELGSAGWGWLYAPAVLDKVRIRVTPASPSSTLFVGIGPSRDVDQYLAGVSQTVISDFWTEKTKVVDGATTASAPGRQNFWVASTTGAGDQTVEWEPADGSWAVVVMNADGRPGIDMKADLGARLPALPWVSLGLMVGGAVFAVGGALLVTGAARRYRADRSSAA